MTEEREPDQIGEDALEGSTDEPEEGPDVSELDEDPAYNAEGPAGDLKGG